MCEPCGLAWQAWLDYRLPPVLSITYGSGAAYDNTAAGIRDREKARFQEWRDTVRHQQGLIEQLCAKGRHVAPRGPGGESSPSASQPVSLPSL